MHTIEEECIFLKLLRSHCEPFSPLNSAGATLQCIVYIFNLLWYKKAMFLY